MTSVGQFVTAIAAHAAATGAWDDILAKARFISRFYDEEGGGIQAEEVPAEEAPADENLMALLEFEREHSLA